VRKSILNKSIRNLTHTHTYTHSLTLAHTCTCTHTFSVSPTHTHARTSTHTHRLHKQRNVEEPCEDVSNERASIDSEIRVEIHVRCPHDHHAEHSGAGRTDLDQRCFLPLHERHPLTNSQNGDGQRGDAVYLLLCIQRIAVVIHS
jgi:hypothetical protein